MVLTSLAEKRRATLAVENQRENHAIGAYHSGQELKSQADSDIRIAFIQTPRFVAPVPESNCRP